MNQLHFTELNIQPQILKSLSEMGFTQPTEIQEQAIPKLMDSFGDFVGQAQTGTGKTAAFVIPLLQKISEKSRDVEALILTPTRELAHQVENEIYKIGKYTNIKSTTVYGGTSYDKQIKALKKERPQIVVGTPGRVIDMINKGHLKLDQAKFCILDEADEMLNMGFLDDVKIILDLFNEKRQLIMFSATMPKAILNLIENSFNSYDQVKIKRKSLSNDSIEQKYFVVREKHFKEALSRLIDSAQDMYGIIFCRTRLETKEVADDLKKKGHDVEVLNGDMGQAERDHSMRRFKDQKVRLMVCTDVAARGIDVNNLTHVINYGLPQDNESYVHRIGRTGRAGQLGKAYTIVGPRTSFAIKRIEKHINSKIEKSKLPKISELKKQIVEKEISGAKQILESIKSKGDNFKTDESFEVFSNLFDGLSQDELLKLMFTWKFNKVIRHYDNLSDIEHDEKDRPREMKTRSSRSSSRRAPRDKRVRSKFRSSKAPQKGSPEKRRRRRPERV